MLPGSPGSAQSKDHSSSGLLALCRGPWVADVGDDGIGMARTRNSSDKSSVPGDRECREDCERARRYTLATKVLCVLETLSWRTNSSKDAFCLGSPRGMGLGIPFLISGWDLVNAVKGLGSRRQPNSLIALLVLPPFVFDTAKTHQYLAV